MECGAGEAAGLGSRVLWLEAGLELGQRGQHRVDCLLVEEHSRLRGHRLQRATLREGDDGPATRLRLRGDAGEACCGACPRARVVARVLSASGATVHGPEARSACGVIKAIKVERTPRLVLDVLKEANKWNVELRVVASPEVAAVLKKFDETAKLMVCASVPEAQRSAA